MNELQQKYADFGHFYGQTHQDQGQDQDYKTKTLTQYCPRAQCTQY